MTPEEAIAKEKEISRRQTLTDEHGKEWREDGQGVMEESPFPSIPWELEPDGSAVEEKLPDRYRH